jgi:hypothetical protein
MGLTPAEERARAQLADLACSFLAACVVSWLGVTVRQKRLRSWYKNKLELSKLVAKEERKKAVAGGAI